MRHLLLATLAGLLLAGCSSQVVVVTATPEPATVAPPTSTPQPTETLTPVPPTPDLRVIDLDPRRMVMPKHLLPAEGKFFLADETPNRNSEIISARGADEGARYLEETGRVDGWIVLYSRGTRTARVPEYVQAIAVLFETSDGPDFLFEEGDSAPCGDSSEGYSLVRDDLALGDRSALCVWKEMQPSGRNFVILRAQLAYRNVYVGIYAGGLEDTFDEDWVVALAEGQLEFLQTLELAEAVTYRP